MERILDCNRPIDDKVIMAVKKLASSNAFYSPIVSRIRVAYKPELPTMAMSNNLVIVVGDNITNFVKNDNELVAVTQHELMHYIHDHHARYKKNKYKDRLPFMIHNVAMDLEVNEYIKDMPAESMLSSTFKLPSGKGVPSNLTYEEYMDIIANDISCKYGSIENFLKCAAQQLAEQYEKQMGGSDVNMDGEDDGDNESIINRIAKEEVIKQCEKAANKAGVGTNSDLSDRIRKVNKKKYPWKNVLKKKIHNKSDEIISGANNRTFAMSNRKMSQYTQNTGVIFAKTYDFEVKMDLVVGVDVSGSMGHLVDNMYSILKSISDNTNIKLDITTIECDTKVGNVMRNFNPMASSIKSSDGGGTEMDAILDWVIDNNMDPDLVIIMTDNQTNWSDDNKYNKIKHKVSVLTTEIMDTCPYKQYPVEI